MSDSNYFQFPEKAKAFLENVISARPADFCALLKNRTNLYKNCTNNKKVVQTWNYAECTQKICGLSLNLSSAQFVLLSHGKVQHNGSYL